MEKLCREFARKKSSGEFARRKMNHQQPSPQSSFLSRALHASMEAAWRPKRRFLLHANRVSNVLTSVPIHGGDQSDTGGSDEQVRFCQQLGLAPPCLEPYAGQHCSCDRFVIDADHLHTCQQHSGNWYAAHERLLTVVDEIVRAAGFRTKRRYVATSRGDGEATSRFGMPTSPTRLT